MTYQLHHGNMLDILPMMERESIDAIVTDPPYGLTPDGKTHELGHPSWNTSTQSSRRGGFMGKDWDHGVPGEHFWREAYRVAKPGAHLLAFGGTRTFHRLACAIEDAGWEIRDTVMWVYGQGFPKSHDVSKAIDREAGAEREVIGKYISFRPNEHADTKYNGNLHTNGDITSPATPAAAEWDGWGTALKPAWEPIIVARKPLQGTVAENVQRYGTGAMNVDACRIETGDDISGGTYGGVFGASRNPDGTLPKAIGSGDTGRWPANLIHDGSAEVLAGFPNVQGMKRAWMGNATDPRSGIYMDGLTSAGWRYGDTGSAARFFYCAKASKQDRDEGCEGFELSENVTRYAQRGKCVKCGRWQESGETACVCGGVYERQSNQHKNNNGNHHPTVKPTALMRYLCRLVTPPNGVILDPFMGSGSTGKAAMLEGFNFVGVDTEIEYVEIAARRIEAACEKVGIVVDQPMMFETRRKTVDRPKQLILL